jgi:hypothetical protein
MISQPVVLETTFIRMEEVGIEDALLVISLRSSRDDSALSPVSASISEQRNYLEKYSERRSRNEEVYLKIFSRDVPDNPVGLVRITELNAQDRFSWESLIIKKGVPPAVVLDTVVSIYSIGFITLGKSICGPWQVPASAPRVKKVHESMGMAELINENDDAFLFVVTRRAFQKKIGFFNRSNLGKSSNPSLWGF